MELHVIGTGSSGNAYILRAGEHALLLDAGLPIKTIMRAADWKALQGCLITHEHQDHAKAAKEVARMGLQTYMTEGTLEAINGNGILTALNAVQMLSPFDIGELTVMAFEAQHDAIQPCGWLIRYKPTGETALYATDTYYLKYTFPGVDYWIIECNYVDEIVDAQQQTGEISCVLRSRLKKSHLSLRRLLDMLRANDLAKAKAVVLIHLSAERSDERAMVAAVKEVTGLDEVYAAVGGQRIPLKQYPF